VGGFGGGGGGGGVQILSGRTTRLILTYIAFLVSLYMLANFGLFVAFFSAS